MREESFAAFILTHGRADRVHTYSTLLKAGFTGRIFIVIDNEDDQREQYEKKFKGKVIVFDKRAVSETFDEGDNFGERKAIIYARNACFEIAKQLGVRYFIELDDDYTRFDYRFTSRGEYCETPIKSIDAVFDSMVEFLKRTRCVSVAMAQSGDFFGGPAGNFGKRIKLHRKAMNSFVCDALSPFRFYGRINEDVNVYTCSSRMGKLFFTIQNVSLKQKRTQSNPGGMTELYLNSGTYVKSFYSVMYAPSCTKIAVMGDTNRRLHHRVAWNNAAPMILAEHHRKLA